MYGYWFPLTHLCNNNIVKTRGWARSLIVSHARCVYFLKPGECTIYLETFLFYTRQSVCTNTAFLYSSDRCPKCLALPLQYRYVNIRRQSVYSAVKLHRLRTTCLYYTYTNELPPVSLCVVFNAHAARGEIQCRNDLQCARCRTSAKRFSSHVKRR
jgi:hypothetical protein